MVVSARAWGIAAIGIACACAPDTSGLGGGDSAAPVDPSSTGTSEGPATSTTGAPADTGTTDRVDDTTAAASTDAPPSDDTTTDAPGGSSETGEGPKVLEQCDTPGLAIPDADEIGVSSTTTVSEAGTVVDVRVILQVDHMFVGDLRVALFGNAGQVAVIDRPDDADLRTDGNCGGLNIDAELHDAAPVTVDGVCLDGADPGIFGEVQPDQPFEPVFAGQSMTGNWRLQVADVATEDEGVFQSWCLRITYE